MSFFVFELLKMIDGVPANAVNTDKHIAFLSANIVSVDINSYPLGVPELDAFSRSFENHLFLEVVALGATKAWGFELIGSNQPVAGTPENPLCVCMAGTTGSLYVPVSSESAIATVRMDTNYFSPDDPYNLDIDCEPADNQLDAIGERTKIIVLQYKVYPGCPQGNLNRQYYALRHNQN